MGKAVIIIPARMESTRFPNKPKAVICGMTMIERVWRLGKACHSVAEVVIATDDEGLRDFAKGFGAEVVMTSCTCLTGTDRVAEASHHFPQHDLFFSLQGDAVLTPPWVIEKVLQVMLSDPAISIATPAVALRNEALNDFVQEKKGGNSSGTTVTFDQRGNALYFSKAIIPFSRSEKEALIYRHIGLYGYRKEVLQKLHLLPEGRFEKIEKLEQLRALENGIPIRVVEVDYRGRTHGSVDRPEDVAIVEAIIAREGELV